MTRTEFAMFAAAMKAYFPKETILPNEQAMELWYRTLGDIPFDSAEKFLISWVSQNKWSPTISEIRKGVYFEEAEKEVLLLQAGVCYEKRLQSTLARPAICEKGT